MSIPHSKILSVSKGVGLDADLHYNSPSSTQVVNVNINKANDESNKEPLDNVNPYSSLPNEQASNNNEVKREVDERDALLQYKDNVIEALHGLLKIVENNPLIVNKFIVASIDDLKQLIKLLTGADDVHINTNEDIDCNCCGSDLNFVSVDKIYILKGNDTLNFKYSFPDANKILDDHHVSVKLVKV